MVYTDEMVIYFIFVENVKYEHGTDDMQCAKYQVQCQQCSGIDDIR